LKSEFGNKPSVHFSLAWTFARLRSRDPPTSGKQRGVATRVLPDRWLSFILPGYWGGDVAFHLQGAGTTRAAEFRAG
jgi:hypothetical protein